MDRSLQHGMLLNNQAKGWQRCCRRTVLVDQDSWTFVVTSGSSRHGQVHRWVGGAAFWAPDLAQIVLPPKPGVILAQHTAALSFWCCMKQMVLSLACSGLESTLEQLEVGLNEAGNRLQAEDLCLARKGPSGCREGATNSWAARSWRNHSKHHGLPLPSSCPKKHSFLFHTC